MLEPIKVLLSSNPIRAYTVIIGLILALFPLIYSAVKDIKEQEVVVYQLLLYDGIALLFNIIIACMSNRGLGYIISSICAVPLTIYLLYINNNTNSDTGIGKGDIDLLSPLVSIIICDIVYFIIDNTPKSFNFFDITVLIYISALLLIFVIKVLIKASLSNEIFNANEECRKPDINSRIRLYIISLLIIMLYMQSFHLKYVNIALYMFIVIIILSIPIFFIGIYSLHYFANILSTSIILAFIIYMYVKGAFSFPWTTISIYLISTFIFYMLLGMIGGIIVWFIWFLYERIRGRVRFKNLMYDTKIPMIPMLIVPCIMTLYTIYVL